MMKRVLKLVLPILVLAEVVLVWSGVIDLGDALLVVAGVEVLLFLAGLGGLVLMVRRYRGKREAGLDPWRALEDALSLILPRELARLAVKEPRLFASLFRWTFRRVELAENEFGYYRRSTLRAIVPLLIISAPIELVIVHLLAHAFSPWSWVKWALLVLGIYAILWILGLYASLVTLPHRLEETGLRLRHGLFVEGYVPYGEIKDTVRMACKAPNFGDGLSCVPDEDALYLVTGGKTDLTLRLRAPHSVERVLKESKPACFVHLAADDPERLARELRRRVEASASGVEHSPVQTRS